MTAATTAAKVANQLRSEIPYSSFREFFWIDSQVVLGNIKNSTKKFHMFVANRIQTIQEVTKTDQWNYVSSKNNPADVASRGQSIKNFLQNSEWFNGPAFLYQADVQSNQGKFELKDDDPEVKQSKRIDVHRTQVNDNRILDYLLSRISNWFQCKKDRCNYLTLKIQTKSHRCSSCFHMKEH